MADRERLRRRLMILTGCLVTLVVVAFARMAYGLLLPAMRQDLGLSFPQAGTLGTVTALGYLCFVLVGGIAASRWGSRAAVLLGLALASIGFAGLAFSSDYRALMVFMTLLGMGTAFSYAPVVSLLAAWFPAQRGLVIGLLASGVGVGLLLAGLLVPRLESALGVGAWRISWGVFGLCSVAVAALSAAFLRDPPTPAGHAVAPVTTAEKLAIYRDPRVLTVALVYGIVGLSYIVQGIFMVSYMLDAGVPSATAGQLVAVSGLLYIASAPAWGKLSDRIGRGSALTLCMAVTAAAMALPVIVPNLAAFTVHYLVFGCTIGGVFTLVQAAGTEQVAPRHIPLAFSFITVFFAGGQLVGPAVVGYLIEHTGSFRVALSFTCSGLILGIYLADKVRRFSPLPAVSPAAAERPPARS